MAATDPAILVEPCRFSIRLPRPHWIGVVTALLIVAAAALRVGLPVYRQQVAIRQIERAGGNVKTKSSAPNWLRQIVGSEWLTVFDDPVVVSVMNRRIDESDLRNLACFTRLEKLWLGGTAITDDDLACLKGLTNLYVLDLSGTKVTDAGMMHVREVSRLETLYVDGTQVTDLGLEHLEGKTSLRRIGYYRSHITADGMASLKHALPDLEIKAGPVACSFSF